MSKPNQMQLELPFDDSIEEQNYELTIHREKVTIDEISESLDDFRNTIEYWRNDE